MSSGHDQFEELAVGHALGALEPEDEQTFLAHLPGCGPCRRALADFEALGAQLAYAAEPAEPADALHRRVLEITAGAAAVALPHRQPGSWRPAPASRRRRVGAGLRRGSAGPRTHLPWAAVAAAIAVVLALGTWNLVLHSDARASAQAVAQRDDVLRLIDSGAQPVPLRAVGSGDVGSGYAVVRGQTLWLVLDQVPPTAVGRDQLAVWATPDGLANARYLDRFVVQHAGLNVYESGRLTGLDGHPSLAVSREPGEAVPSRPGQILLASPPAG